MLLEKGLVLVLLLLNVEMCSLNVEEIAQGVEETRLFWLEL